MALLRREVLVPVPSFRRPSSLIGLSIVLVLLASAVDAVVWTYQAKREAEERAAREELIVPPPARVRIEQPRDLVEPALIKPAPADDIIERRF